MNHFFARRTAARRLVRVAAAAAAAGSLALAGTAAFGVVRPGTPAKDVHVGLDDDNATNTFIQPPGVTAKQHMDNTDLLFGRGNDDLLIGKLGSDTEIGGPGSDILVGGPERGQAPNSDVLVGDRGNDVNIWAPGDGSDAYAGQEGYDTMIFAPFVTDGSGDLVLERKHGRQVPRVVIDSAPRFSCTIVPVPPSLGFGFQYLVRFNVDGTPVATVRQKDVEQVLCPSPYAGMARVARLTDPHPTFRDVPLSHLHGVVGDIVAPAS